MGDAASWFALTYASVLAAELLGDRSLYSIAALASRFRPSAVLLGVSAGFAAKAYVAVILAGFVARMPRPLLMAVSAVAFLVSAVLIWRDAEAREASRESVEARRAGHVVPTAFAAIFFTEWADPGQLATATLAARSHMAIVIWAGATLALTTKGVLAATLGVGLRHYVPRQLLRRGAIVLCLLLSGLSLVVAA